MPPHPTTNCTPLALWKTPPATPAGDAHPSPALRTAPPASSGLGRAIPSHPGSLRPGRVLDGYRIERRVGGGGFAEVFQTATPLGATLAMKVLRPELAVLPDERARFRWEPRLMNAARHPGVPRALHNGTTPCGRPYFVMDWIDGETLDARAARLGGRLPAREVGRIGVRLARILEAAHAAGVLHLDVKPENAFATRDGRVILGDFGIARWIDPRAGDARAASPFLGTPMFMAPEQATGAGLGPWTDVRALGATLFVLLTGHNVCSTRALATTLGHAFAPPRPVLSVMPTAPAPLARLIDRCLAPDPTRRPTAREIAHSRLLSG